MAGRGDRVHFFPSLSLSLSPLVPSALTSPALITPRWWPFNRHLIVTANLIVREHMRALSCINKHLSRRSWPFDYARLVDTRHRRSNKWAISSRLGIRLHRGVFFAVEAREASFFRRQRAHAGRAIAEFGPTINLYASVGAHIALLV